MLVGNVCVCQWVMVGDDCGDVVNRKLDEIVCCGVGKGHVALANGTWRGIVVEML